VKISFNSVQAIVTDENAKKQETLDISSDELKLAAHRLNDAVSRLSNNECKHQYFNRNVSLSM
jgi:hypothetical protein